MQSEGHQHKWQHIHIWWHIFAFLSHAQGSALEGEKPMSNMMSWIFWDHLKPERLSPYSALYITNICPSSSSNSWPATM